VTGPGGEEGPVAWLRKQVEARLALAREASPKTDGHWWRRTSAVYTDGTRESVGPLYSGDPDLDDDGEISQGDYIVVYDEGAPSDAQFDHMAASDPRDAIARCEAELAILDEHYILYRSDTSEKYEQYSIISPPFPPMDCGCVTCHYASQGGVNGYGICRTVKYVASGYRHKPGYREEDWRPGVTPWQAGS
jgi:Family of unknown function (DUF6221)